MFNRLMKIFEKLNLILINSERQKLYKFHQILNKIYSSKLCDIGWWIYFGQNLSCHFVDYASLPPFTKFTEFIGTEIGQNLKTIGHLLLIFLFDTLVSALNKMGE